MFGQENAQQFRSYLLKHTRRFVSVVPPSSRSRCSQLGKRQTVSISTPRHTPSATRHDLYCVLSGLLLDLAADFNAIIHVITITLYATQFHGGRLLLGLFHSIFQNKRRTSPCVTCDWSRMPIERGIKGGRVRIHSHSCHIHDSPHRTTFLTVVMALLVRPSRFENAYSTSAFDSKLSPATRSGMSSSSSSSFLSSSPFSFCMLW